MNCYTIILGIFYRMELLFLISVRFTGPLSCQFNVKKISPSAILCKILEKFVRDKVVSHLLKDKLLSSKQYGFISGRSTTTLLLYYLDECINKIVEGSVVVDAIYLDFSKAFDTVLHRRLLGEVRGKKCSTGFEDF